MDARCTPCRGSCRPGCRPGECDAAREICEGVTSPPSDVALRGSRRPLTGVESSAPSPEACESRHSSVFSGSRTGPRRAGAFLHVRCVRTPPDEGAVVDDMDVTRSMSEVAQARWLAEQPLLYTVEEAAGILRIGRTLAYDLVQRFETSGGREGLPAVRVGHCWRVPREVVLQIALGFRTVGTAGQSAAGPGEEPRAARAPRVDSESGRKRRARSGTARVLAPVQRRFRWRRLSRSRRNSAS